MRCVECGYVSVRFDPFTFLSLPLPMDNSVYVEVIGKFLVKSSPYSFKLVSIEALNKLTPLSPNTRSA